ncbi:hypothetical protein HanPSC8_Chr17g0762951 [Helianthus annuus]|nr:hypothetical protein HanPSC8_Chr17g0762951 [Helianthus annuus]
MGFRQCSLQKQWASLIIEIETCMSVMWPAISSRSWLANIKDLSQCINDGRKYNDFTIPILASITIRSSSDANSSKQLPNHN